MIEERPDRRGTGRRQALPDRRLCGSTTSTPLPMSPARSSSCRRNELGIDYISQREKLINEVTRGRRRNESRPGGLLSADPAIMVIGPARAGTAEPG